MDSRCALLLGGVASQPTEGRERDQSRFSLDPVEQQQDDPLPREARQHP